MQHLVDGALERLPARLRRAREHRSMTLTELSRETGISTSTLSRLESGQRKASLELLLPISLALEVPLGDLVAAPTTEDPRVHLPERQRGGRTILPLSRHQHEPKAFKLTIPASDASPDPRTHAGYEWLYVLAGTMRLVLGAHDLELGPGEVAEFPTEQPHWFGSTGRGPVELLSLFGTQGEMMHIRASTQRARQVRPTG